MEEFEGDVWNVDEVVGWAEFCCWSALAMAPIIYWLQGSSVSNDQFVVRKALVICAAAGGIVLRTRAISRRRGSPKSATPSSTEDGRQLDAKR